MFCYLKHIPQQVFQQQRDAAWSFTAAQTQTKQNCHAHIFTGIGVVVSAILNAIISAFAFRTSESHVGKLQWSVNKHQPCDCRIEVNKLQWPLPVGVGHPALPRCSPRIGKECRAPLFLLLPSSAVGLPGFQLVSSQNSWTFIRGLSTMTTSLSSLCLCPGFADSSREI